MGRPATHHQQHQIPRSTTTNVLPLAQLSTATQNVCLTPIACGYPSLPPLSCGEGEVLLSAPSLCMALFNSLGSSTNLDKEPQAESDVHDVGEHALAIRASRVLGTGYGILKEAIGVVHRRTRIPPTAHLHCDVRVHLHGYGHAWTSSSSSGGYLNIGPNYGALAVAVRASRSLTFLLAGMSWLRDASSLLPSSPSPPQRRINVCRATASVRSRCSIQFHPPDPPSVWNTIYQSLPCPIF
jgi:hypothetical protein